MRSPEEILSRSTKRRAFANAQSWHRWSYRWCDQCINDINESCPLIAAAMFKGVTPVEWDQVAIDEYECSEFEPREES